MNSHDEHPLSHPANRAVHDLLASYGYSASPHLGAELWGAILKDLRHEGLPHTHADDIFQQMLTQAAGWLDANRHVPLENPRAWLHAIRRHVTIDYLVDARPRAIDPQHFPIIEIQGVDSDTALDLVHKALKHLPPRHQELILLDLGEGLEHHEIRERMHIKSDGYFRKLKSEAFRALREALGVVMKEWIGSLMD